MTSLRSVKEWSGSGCIRLVRGSRGESRSAAERILDIKDMLLDFKEHLLNLVFEELQLLIHMVDPAVYVHVGPLRESYLVGLKRNKGPGNRIKVKDKKGTH